MPAGNNRSCEEAPSIQKEVRRGAAVDSIAVSIFADILVVFANTVIL